jgi:SLA1 homology domain 1, SHD1
MMNNLGGRFYAWVYLVLIGANPGWADDEWRTWKSTSGTAIEAKLTSREGEEITLEKRDGKKVILTLTKLSVEDQNYLIKQNPKDPGSPTIGKIAIPGISAQPGLAQKITCQADPKWSYLLRLPKDFHTGKSWPVCFVMDPGSGTQETINRYAPAAERLGIILAVSSESRNGFADSDLPMKAMLEDVYARIPVLEKVAMASGMSGGSRMAYMMSEINKNVVGVLACASGHGIYLKEKTFRAAKLRSDTVMCSLIGTNDFNRREAVKSHKAIDKNARLIWFPGNHDWAGPELIEDGLAEVYGRILERSKVQNIDALRSDFSRKQLDWAKKQAASAPWLTYYWANFLTKFPGDASVNRDAAVLLASVPKGPELAKAEKAIKDFAYKHFEDGLTQVDKEPVPSRVKDAEKVATTLAGLPQADLIRRMGGPAK